MEQKWGTSEHQKKMMPPMPQILGTSGIFRRCSPCFPFQKLLMWWMWSNSRCDLTSNLLLVHPFHVALTSSLLPKPTFRTLEALPKSLSPPGSRRDVFSSRRSGTAFDAFCRFFFWINGRRNWCIGERKLEMFVDVWHTDTLTKLWTSNALLLLEFLNTEIPSLTILAGTFSQASPKTSCRYLLDNRILSKEFALLDNNTTTLTLPQNLYGCF